MPFPAGTWKARISSSHTPMASAIDPYWVYIAWLIIHMDPPPSFGVTSSPHDAGPRQTAKGMGFLGQKSCPPWKHFSMTLTRQ